MAKQEIISELGQAELLLPSLLNQAFIANDRTKYFFTLLQTARQQAVQPRPLSLNLAAERQSSGVRDTRYDTVVTGSRQVGPDCLSIPCVEEIHAAIVASIDEMIAPIAAADGSASGDGATGADAYRTRLANCLAGAPELKDDLVPPAYIDRLTSGVRRDGDSLHLLVMDLHKELNRLQAALANESIDGAWAYGLVDGDRDLVRAFMRGVNRTAPLKFDHPGLGTTATRVGERLLIQNDIGTTDAHVLVVHVEELAATVTYTDNHLERLLFFQGLLERFPVEWQGTHARRSDALAETNLYHMSVGIYRGADRADLAEYLGYLGSRLVFLIDWNRARKRLRQFVKPEDCTEILAWAAEHDYGHMAFLLLGGERLIFDVMQTASKVPLRYGEPLHEILGRDRAIAFLKFVLRTTSEGVRAGRSELFIRDEIRADLLEGLLTAHETMLGIAADHASLLVELALGVRDGFVRAITRDDGFLERNANRAKGWERRADDLLNRARTVTRREAGTEVFERILALADDVADDLEDAAFLLTLLPTDGTAVICPPLQRLADLVVQSAQEYLKAVENARRLQGARSREELHDFLAAVDEIMVIENQTDTANRETKSILLTAAHDFRELEIGLALGHNLEAAADGLQHVGLVLRAYVLGEEVVR